MLLTLAATAFAQEKPVPPAAPSPPKPPSLTAPEDTSLDQTGAVADPFASGSSAQSTSKGISIARLKEPRPAVHLRLEVWEVPALELAKKFDAGQESADVVKWREEWLAAKEGVQLILSPALSLDATTRVSAESVTEVIYPTEYEPPSPFPSSPEDTSKAALQKWLNEISKTTCPTAFETRNTGETLEAVAHQIPQAKETWDVSLTLEDVHLLGFSTYGSPELEVKEPTYSSFRTGGLIRLKTGEWRLLSSMTPPKNLEPSRPKTRWITLVRIDPVNEK